MHLQQLHELCLSKLGATESLPFDDDVLVFKVGNKMFALTSLQSWENGNPTINLKCDPARNIELRATHEDIIEGYHMSKVHWNTIRINNRVTDSLIIELVDHSYDIVFASLTKKLQAEISS